VEEKYLPGSNRNFIRLAMDIVDVLYMRREPGCANLSGEFLLMMSHLSFDNYEFLPEKRELL
jgi:hypothetical protein